MDYSVTIFILFIVLMVLTTTYFLINIIGLLKLDKQFLYKITCPKSFFIFYLTMVLILMIMGVIKLNYELNFYLIIAMFLASRFLEIYVVAYKKDELYYKHKHIKNFDFYNAVPKKNRMYIKEVKVLINMLDYNRIEYIIGEK